MFEGLTTTAAEGERRCSLLDLSSPCRIVGCALLRVQGFNLLRRFYRGVQEPIHNAAVDVVSGLTGSASGSGEGGLDWSDLQMASDEDTQEMPNPWGEQTNDSLRRARDAATHEERVQNDPFLFVWRGRGEQLLEREEQHQGPVPRGE